MTPWTTVATLKTREGELQLRRRGEREFLITIGGRVLMTSAERHSEEALAKLSCGPIADRAHPRVLVGGLGMAYTLRAALDVLPSRARVVVAELTREVVDWCKGPLGVLTANSAADPRVSFVIGDVARVIADAPRGHFDAILLDLYEGPHHATQRRDDPFYGPAALARTRAALADGGRFAVWSEEPDAPFSRRFASAGFAVETHKLGKSRTHVVYVGTPVIASTRR
ncbi:MAG TPA: hypothetical protein VGM88_11885 [Kofleriaceae bacterium]|jgi:spermidine synthase